MRHSTHRLSSQAISHYARIPVGKYHDISGAEGLLLPAFQPNVAVSFGNETKW
jgi:hypothetical protein